MSLVSRSIPGLFGGVSQQIPAMRHPTQGAAQDNGLATVTDGLYKRAGSKFIAQLALTGANGASVAGSSGNATVHWIDKGDQGLYALVLVNGNLMLYDAITGAPQTVSFPNGLAYLTSSAPARSFRALTVADYTFVVNTEKVPAMTSTVTASNPTNVAYVNIRTAVPRVAYTVTVNGAAVTITAGDIETNASIAVKVRNALAAAYPSDVFSIVPGTNVIKLTFTVTTMTSVTCSDGWANLATQTVHKGVDTFAELPPRFEANGFVVSINGYASTAKDKYYVRWNGDRWEECAAPALLTTLNATTMPHQLRPTGTGSWVFEQAGPWSPRKVGDEETNPLPSFIGTAIRGLFFFRNRLGFLAGDSVILSRAGSYFNFFASSATQVLATDPIDLGATAEQVNTLDWVVPYNETLLVFASGKQQFVLTAGDVLSPATARLLPSTTFETDNAARPAPLGNRLVFPSNTGSFTQLSLYRVSEDTVTNRAENLTEHVPSYIPSDPLALVASTAVKALVVIPRGTTQVLPLFKYETDDRDVLTQKAWQRIIFESTDTVRVLGALWRGRTLVLAMHVQSSADPSGGGRFRLESIDFEPKAVDPETNFGVRLDARATVTAGAFDGTVTAITVPYLQTGPITLIKVVPGVEPVDLVQSGGVIHDTVNLRTIFSVVGNYAGASVIVGRPFMFRYVFSEAVLRDPQGNPIEHTKLKLVRMLVRYRATGYFVAKVVNLLRGAYSYPRAGRDIGVPGQGASQLSLSDGTFSVPVQAVSTATVVSIESDSYFPVNLPFAEWVGDVTMKASR